MATDPTPDPTETLAAWRAVTEGASERGPVRDGWCCWTCADLAEATLPDDLRAALAEHLGGEGQ